MRPETTAEYVVQTRWRSGLGNLGPFIANYTVQATPVTGVASTASPSSRSGRQALDVELHLSFDLDLGAILPELRLPSASVEIPSGAHVMTPKTRVAWPTVPVRLSHRDCVSAHEPNTNSVSLLAAIALAVSDVILDIPFAAPLLSIALDEVLATVGVEGAARFLQTIISSLATFPGAVVPAMDSIAAVKRGSADGVERNPADYASESEHVLEPAWA